jgi:uncharacterized protein YodC (DUF2158 family)
MEIKIGDVVGLTCGGERMTVLEAKEDGFVCGFWQAMESQNIWGLGTAGRKLDTRKFPGDALVVLETKEAAVQK